MPYTRHVSNAAVRGTTAPLSHLVNNTALLSKNTVSATVLFLRNDEKRLQRFANY